MAKSSGVGPVDDSRTAAALAEHLLDNWDLLRAVNGARALGPRGVDVVESVLADRSISFLECSWRLWESLHSSDGYDTDGALRVYMPASMIEVCRVALDVPRQPTL